MTSTYKKAVEVFGETEQINMLFEELGELISSINRHRRGRKDKSSVEEELADVQIMLYQMRYIFNPDIMDDWVLLKTSRLKSLIEGE